MDQGSIIAMKGYVVQQLHIRNLSLVDIEQYLGLYKGTLANGASFWNAMELPKKGGFEFIGYSRVPGHHTSGIHREVNINDLSLKEQEKYAYSTWTLSGIFRLVKIMPANASPESTINDRLLHPSHGIGAPQWKLTAPIRFRLDDVVKEYPSGIYVPSDSSSSGRKK